MEKPKEIPEDIKLFYDIRLLGKPFSDLKGRKIQRGYIYNGKKYYEKDNQKFEGK